MADLIFLIAAVYLALGVAFALWFAFRGVNRIDDVAAHGSLGFRLLILPGSAMLWPVMLVRALRGGR